MKLLQMGELFALPLQSAIKAQSLALQETISFIEEFGLENGAAKVFKIKSERQTEELSIDKKTNVSETTLKTQPVEINIPILALISPPSVQLQEMNVEFGVEIVEPKNEPIKSKNVPSKILGSSFASSSAMFTSLAQPSSINMKVNMKIVRDVPEGMSRFSDALIGLMGGRSVTTDKEPAKSLLK